MVILLIKSVDLNQINCFLNWANVVITIINYYNTNKCNKIRFITSIFPLLLLLLLLWILVRKMMQLILVSEMLWFQRWLWMHCFPSFIFQVRWLLCHVSLNILLYMIICIWRMYFLSYKIFLNILKRSRKFCLSVDLMLSYILGYKDFHTMCFLNLIIKQISLIFNFYKLCEISYVFLTFTSSSNSSHPYPHIFDSSFCSLLKYNWCCPMFLDAWPST